MTKHKKDSIIATLADEDGNEVEVLAKPVGRPTLFNEERAEKLIAFIKENPSKASAAHHVEISPKTLDLWLKKGKDGDPRFLEFYSRFMGARDTTKADMIKRARDLAMQDQNPAAAIRALQWYYHQFWPEEESKKDMKISMTQELSVKNIDEEDADRLHEIVRKLTSGED